MESNLGEDPYEAIADRCLEKNIINIGAKYISSLSFDSNSPYFYRVNINRSNSGLVKMMSIYFQENNNAKELEYWINTLKKIRYRLPLF